MSIYKRYSDETKYMYFMTKDYNFSDKYVTIWEKVGNITKTVLMLNLYITKNI